MAEGTTELLIKPQDGWVAAVTGPAVHVYIRAPRQAIGVAVGASAPSLDDTPASANLSYSGRPTAGVKSTGALTFTDDTGAGTLVADGEQVVIGSITYTFVDTLSGAANEILIGTHNTDAAANLEAAINGAAGAGSTYGTGTVAHTRVEASLATLVLTVTALLNGSADDTLATTTDSAGASWGAATLVDATVGETITLGSQTYRFVTALSKPAHVAGGIANEVLKGANAAGDYDNLAAAVNGTGTEGTTYGTDTVSRPSNISASNDGVDDITFSAGPGDNGVAVSEALSNASFDGSATSLSGGAPAVRGFQPGALSGEYFEIIQFDDVQGNVYVRALEQSANRATYEPIRVAVVVTGT